MLVKGEDETSAVRLPAVLVYVVEESAVEEVTKITVKSADSGYTSPASTGEKA
jgi:hypothetical protein